MKWRIRGVLELRFETKEAMMEFYYNNIEHGAARMFNLEEHTYIPFTDFKKEYNAER